MEITEYDKKKTAFSDEGGFRNACRMANALVSSTIVPTQFRGKENIGNALIAIEMAQRINASPMAVMQNLHIINGKPSWSSSFIIAVINQCGRFKPLRFIMSGEGDEKQCIAITEDHNGNSYESPPVTIAMAKNEGWHGKNGSKWRTMPDLMLRYRAASFFGRLYAPELLMGMYSEHEQNDIKANEVHVTTCDPTRTIIEAIED